MEKAQKQLAAGKTAEDPRRISLRNGGMGSAKMGL